MSKEPNFMDQIIPVNDNKDESNKYLELIFQQIFSKEDIELKTDLTLAQVQAFSKALIFADKYQVGVLKTISYKMMELLISKDRQGRKEFAQISARAQNDIQVESSMFDKLIGK